MNVVRLGWVNLKRPEKGIIFISLLVAVGLSYISLSRGEEVISNLTIGPLILMWAVLQSTILTGLIRARSMAMNGMFVELMKELADAKIRLGEGPPEKIERLVRDFLGDKK